MVGSAILKDVLAKPSGDSRLLEGYLSIESDIDKVPVLYQKRMTNLRQGVKDRIESVEIALAGLYESKGDGHYRENRFEEAYKHFINGKGYTEKISSIKKREIEQRLTKKIETTLKTGENFVKNQVRTYLDQAEYLNLQDKTGDAKSSLQLAKKAIEESVFTPAICEEWYRETATLLGVGTNLTKKSEYISEIKTSGKTFKNSIGMEFVEIPAGSFLMGCSNGDSDCYDWEKPQHKVSITRGFYMGKYEVTQGQWKKIMGDNPSYFKNFWSGDDYPVEQVSWNDIQTFLQKLNAKEGGSKYRLPTEAEWEYSARAGTSTKYYWGNSIDDSYLWYDGNSGNTTHPVGQKKPNAFGLYDMSGNVWEWVQDWYDGGYYGKSPSSDPKGAVTGGRRVIRGGSWADYAGGSRVSYRDSISPGYRGSNVGFHLVLLP